MSGALTAACYTVGTVSAQQTASFAAAGVLVPWTPVVAPRVGGEAAHVGAALLRARAGGEEEEEEELHRR